MLTNRQQSEEQHFAAAAPAGVEVSQRLTVHKALAVPAATVHYYDTCGPDNLQQRQIQEVRPAFDP